MYNILIVDDEQLMRSYLANNITAICPSYQITGIACDGIDAMELLKHRHFDLVITDIRMPAMDGLSLCKFIYETAPDTKIVIISGYNDFEYARTAIKYQVTEYLLKPLNDDNLYDVLMDVKESLDGNQKNLVPTSFGQNKEMTSLDVFSAFLLSIIEGNTNQVYTLYEAIEDRALNFMKQYACLVLFTIDELNLMLLHENNYDLTTHHLKLYKICQSFCNENNIVSVYDNHSCVLLFFSEDTLPALQESITRICCDLQDEFASNKLPKITIACGKYFSDIMDAPLSAMSAYDTLALTLKNLSNPIFYESYLKEEGFINQLNQISSKIYEDYLKNDTEHLYFSIQQFCNLFKKPITLSTMLRSGSYLIRYICSRSNIKAHYINGAYKELTMHVEQLMPHSEYRKEDIFNALCHTVSRLNSPNNRRMLSETNQIVNLATNYILKHYDEPLSLSLIADKIGVNSCYLSDLIHKNLGQSYSKYLLKIRMEQAVQMMRQNPGDKVYSIAGKVGFVSTKHFISVFKKYYGLTPTAYMEQSLNSVIPISYMN